MSDMAEMLRGIKDHRKALRAVFGLPCPECVVLLPKADPTILLPGQRCRIHGYRDPRPELTSADYQAVADNMKGAA